MPTYQKIPKKIKAKGCVAHGGYCVFAPLTKSVPAFKALKEAHARGGIPGAGYVTVKGVKYWYCLAGLVDDPDIYAK